MKTAICGSYYGIHVVEGLFSVRAGDIVDLAEPEWVLHEIANDRVQLALSGPIGEQRIGANVKDLAAAKKMVAEAAKHAKRPKRPRPP